MRVTVVPLQSSRLPGSPPDLHLAATLYLPDGRAPGLIVGHGAGSRRQNHDEFCRLACSQGFAVLALDLRGHGESGGCVDGPLEQDILAAAHFLRCHPAVDPARICYRGSSMGGFYGLKAASDPMARFAAAALLCPATERVMLDALAQAEDRSIDAGTESSPSSRWDVPALQRYFQAQDSLDLAAAARCPVLIVHARDDRVVPLDGSLALAGRLAGDATLLALAGGSHTSAQHDPVIHHLTARWLWERVTSACTERT